MSAPTAAELFAELLRPVVAELVAEQLALLDGRPPVEWLTVEEYAERQRTTTAAIHKRLERRQVPGAVREGRRWLIPDSRPATIVPDIDKWGERRVNGPAPGTGGKRSHA